MLRIWGVGGVGKANMKTPEPVKSPREPIPLFHKIFAEISIVAIKNFALNMLCLRYFVKFSPSTLVVLLTGAILNYCFLLIFCNHS